MQEMTLYDFMEKIHDHSLILSVTEEFKNQLITNTNWIAINATYLQVHASIVSSTSLATLHGSLTINYLSS